MMKSQSVLGAASDMGSASFTDALLMPGQSSALIARIVNTMVDAVLVHQNGKFIFANAAAAEILGASSPQALIGYPVMNCVDPDSRASVTARIQRMMQQEGATAELVEHCLLRLDGSRFYAEMQASRLEGEPPMILVVARDVTERHRQEAELARMQLIMDQAHDPIYATDLDGNYILLNQAAERLLKRTREELIGKPFAPYLAPESLEIARVMMQRKLDGEIENSTYELDIIDADGGRHPMENSSTLVRDEAGNLVAIQGVLRDLRRRRKHLEQIRLLSQAMEHVEESIFLAHLDGAVFYANAAAARFYGQPTEALHGQLLAQLRQGEPNDAIYREILAHVTQGKLWYGEITARRQDGEERTFMRTAAPIPASDGAHAAYYVCIDRDITELRQQQSKLEHTQRLESLGVLAGGIAHDFNNILTAILGNAELAVEKLMRKPLDARTNLIRISQSSERAAKLCQQMLAYSGKGQFVVRPLNLSDEVRAMSSLLQVTLGKQVDLVTELDASLPAIQADEAQMQQVIMNLITNANEAMEGAGTITLRTGTMQADLPWLRDCVGDEELRPGRYVLLQVLDDGCGMDTATQSKLFDPFFTTKFTGRGLGMSAILGIVRGHHGYLHLESQVGRGTTFTLLFPPVEQPLDVSEETSGQVALVSSAGRTVLVVDDEEPIREAAGMMLSDAGFSILTACDGVEAVALFEQRHEEIDVVLLDLTMPRMDGETALLALREIDPTVRVLVSSGYSAKELAARFANHRVAGFVGKPYTPQRLIAAVGEALRDHG
ncbi:MAG: PAS domain S-box protein [Mariprofundales bacterium]